MLAAVKGEIAASRARAARAVNAELISMYWRIGALILERQAAQGWGAQVIERLPADLRASFPGARGISRRNLHYMRAFAEAWPEEVPQPVAQLPCGHVRVLPDRPEDHEARQWYATRDAAEGWSRAVLETMVVSRLHLRQGVAPSNFPATLPGADSDLAQEITRDPYVFDFVRLHPGYRELDVQAALVAELRQLLQELDTGFAIMGERSPLVVGDSEFFPDLLCYHTRLHRYVVFELKLGRFDPRNLGQLQFYVQAVDHQVRGGVVDAATIGVLLVADRDDTVVQYALQASTAPVAVSRYELPEDVRTSLPADEALIAVGRDVTRVNAGPKLTVMIAGGENDDAGMSGRRCPLAVAGRVDWTLSLGADRATRGLRVPSSVYRHPRRPLLELNAVLPRCCRDPRHPSAG